MKNSSTSGKGLPAGGEHPKNIITSDQRGFAGVRPPTTQPPPASIRSPEVNSLAPHQLRRAPASSELAFSSGEGLLCRRKTSRKIITSDHGGFAGVRPPTTQPPPASIRSPELNSPAQHQLRRAPSLSELALSSGKGLPAGGEYPKTSSPPITAASPEFGIREKAHLRPAFASGR